MPSGEECFWKLSPTSRSPNSGAFMSQPTAWPPDQLPCGLAPIASALLMPAPVLKRVARPFARSPGRAEGARAHLGVALEAAAGQHDRLGADPDLAALVAGDDAAHDAVLLDQ